MNPGSSAEEQASLRAAATAALADRKQEYEVERSRLASSLLIRANRKAAADRAKQQQQLPIEQASSAQQSEPQQSGSVAAAYAYLWEPLERNREADKVFRSRKFSQEQLPAQYVSSPDRY